MTAVESGKRALELLGKVMPYTSICKFLTFLCDFGLVFDLLHENLWGFLSLVLGSHIGAGREHDLH